MRPKSGCDHELATVANICGEEPASHVGRDPDRNTLADNVAPAHTEMVAQVAVEEWSVSGRPASRSVCSRRPWQLDSVALIEQSSRLFSYLYSL
jgi:hypothetical protein